MRITIYAAVTFRNDDNQETHGYRTHIITLSNEEAVDKLLEHFQAGALDNAGLGLDDFLEYDDNLDQRRMTMSAQEFDRRVKYVMDTKKVSYAVSSSCVRKYMQTKEKP